VTSPQTDSQTTINRRIVRNGVSLDEITSLIDKRNTMEHPHDLITSLGSAEYVVTSTA
jgi:hypothetical protein